MFKIMKEEAPNYLINLIPKSERTIRTRNNRIPVYYCRTESFKHSSFPYTLKDRFSLDDNIRNSETISTFKNGLLSFIHPVQTIYSIGLKFFTRLRLGFSHHYEQRFRNYLQDCMNPLYSHSLEIKDTLHYLLHCYHFNHIRIDRNSVK